VNIVIRLRSARPRYRGPILGRSLKFFSFRKCPDLLWGPQNLLFRGYRRSFPQLQIGHGVKLTTRLYVQIQTVEFSVDLGSGLHWKSVTILCLWPIKDVFHVKKCIVLQCSRAFCVWDKTVILCRVLRGYYCAQVWLQAYYKLKKKTASYNDRDSCSWQALYVFHLRRRQC
jgi:hypothetical protein